MALDDDQAANQPLAGVVLCATSILPDVLTKLVDAATQMGAAHHLDLTSDVTHLIVGNVDTQKYKFVAKQRPDIKVLRPQWVEAVREVWMAGEEAVDVESLEQEHKLPTFFTLKLCITNFEDIEIKNYFSEKTEAQGGSFSGDLTKDVTHLIAALPQGAKYAYAKQRGIPVVSRKWFEDSLQRGMALDESLYAPELPIEEQGIGAFRTVRKPSRTSLGKRGRAGEEQGTSGDGYGKRKVRRIASMRLDAQSQDLWQGLSGKDIHTNRTVDDAWRDDNPTADEASSEREGARQQSFEAASTAKAAQSDEPKGLFSGSYILIHGFEPKRANRIRDYLVPNGARVVEAVDELENASYDLFFQNRYLLTPHATPDVELNLPDIPPTTLRTTEWWIERCIHSKTLLDPEDDVLSRPLGDVAVSGLNNFFISTTGFTGVELRQTAEVVKLMNAEYQEMLLPSTQVLVSASDKVKKEKAFYAIKHNIPVVRAEWLLESIRTRTKSSIEKYRIKVIALGHEDVSQPMSTRSPAPSERQNDRSREADHRAEDRPKRLSSSRKRQATPSLTLKSSKPDVPQRGPFIHEDDDDDDDDENDDEEPMPPQDEASSAFNDRAATLPLSQPLRELSPNASPRKESSITIDGMMAKPEKESSKQVDDDRNEYPSQPLSSKGGEQTYEVREATPQSSEHLVEQITSLMERRKASRQEAGNVRSPQKRKSRPLGRNLSGISNRAISASARSESASRNFSTDVNETSNSPADGFGFASRNQHQEEAAPSTQVGYETLEMEAHRKQMSKKMGTNFFEDDDGTGSKRLASLGTLKDSEGITRKSGRNQTKARQQRGQMK